MARREQTPNIQQADLERVVVSDFLIQRPNAIIATDDHQRLLVQRHQLLVASCVIPVMVRGQNGLQLHVLALHGFEDRLGIDRVDNRRLFGLVADDQVHVVVGQRREDLNAHALHVDRLLGAVGTA